MSTGSSATRGNRNMVAVPILVTLFGLPLGVGVGTARAELITWEFAGEIDFVSDPNDRLGGAITVGMPFSGLFAFESTTPDLNPDDTSFGWYLNAVVSVSGQIGGQAFGRDPVDDGGFMAVSDGVDRLDRLVVLGPRMRADFWSSVPTFSLDLVDLTATVFSNDTLPAVPPDLALFDSATFELSSVSDPTKLRGPLTVLVPEPATFGLFALATALLCVRPSTTAPHGPTHAHKLLITQELRYFGGHWPKRPTQASGASP